MKTLLILFTITSLVIFTAALCPSGCTCYNDDPCQYYCGNSQCQPRIPTGYRCSGHYTHPRECGSGYYCESSSSTCQYQKSNGERCTSDYSCLSENCDYTTGTCQLQSSGWQTIFLVPISIVILLTLLFALILIRRRRRLAFISYQSQSQCQSQGQNQTVILPSAAPYSYQNYNMAGGSSSPPYPGPTYTPSSNPYYG